MPSDMEYSQSQDLSRQEVRDMADAYHEYHYAEERGNTLYEMANQFELQGNEQLAYLAQNAAEQYWKLAADVDGTAETDPDLKEKSQALLEYFKWMDDGTLPEPEQDQQAIERAQLLGDQADDLRRAISERANS